MFFEANALTVYGCPSNTGPEMQNNSLIFSVSTNFISLTPSVAAARCNCKCCVAQEKADSSTFGDKIFAFDSDPTASVQFASLVRIMALHTIIGLPTLFSR